MLLNLETINNKVLPVFYNEVDLNIEEDIFDIVDDASQEYENWFDIDPDNFYMRSFIEGQGFYDGEKQSLYTNRHIINDNKCSIFYKTDKNGYVIFDYKKINDHCRLMKKCLLQYFLQKNNDPLGDLKDLVALQNDSYCCKDQRRLTSKAIEQEACIYARVDHDNEYASYLLNFYYVFELAEMAMRENIKIKLAGYLTFHERGDERNYEFAEGD